MNKLSENHDCVMNSQHNSSKHHKGEFAGECFKGKIGCESHSPFRLDLGLNFNPKPKRSRIYLYTYFLPCPFSYSLSFSLTYSPSRVKRAHARPNAITSHTKNAKSKR